jgi:hypothetical protein
LERTSQPALGGSTRVIVATTIVVTALFEPLHRLQSPIDRWFYQGTYDAERTLGECGATLPRVTRLDHLHARLSTVIEETMHLDQVSLVVAPLGTRS